MASFVDTVIPKFTPYIPEIPVDENTKVGIFKQQQYAKGLQQVEGYVNAIGNLPVDNKFAPYIQDKLKSLKDTVNNSLSGDFSDQQLVSHIGSAAKVITQDPIIKNAVLSTQRLQEAEASLKQAKQTGKGYSPSNEWLLQSQINSWRNSDDMNIPFTGSYIPYSDYNSHVLTALKQLNPAVTENPFQRNLDGTVKLDAHGTPMLDTVMLKKYGITRDQVKAAISGAITEADKQQLQIDGLFSLRGETPSSLTDMMSRGAQSRIADLDIKISQLKNVDQSLNPSNKEYQDQVHKQIQSLENQKTDIIQRLHENTDLASRNFNAAKSKYYTESYVDQMAAAYSNESYEYEDSPYQSAIEKERQYQLDLQRLQIAYENLKLKANKTPSTEKPGSSSNNPSGGTAGEAPPQLSGEALINSIKEGNQEIKSLLDKSVNDYAKDHNISPDDVYRKVKAYRNGESLSGVDRADIDNISRLMGLYDRKVTVVTQINNEADKIYGDKLSQSLKNIEPLTIQNTTYSAEELMQFKQDIEKYKPKIGESKFQVGYTTINTAAPFVARNEKEQKLYDYYTRVNGREVNQAIKGITTISENIDKERTKYIAKELATRYNVGQNLFVPIDVSKPELQKKVSGLVNTILSSAEESGKDLEESTGGKHFDTKEANRMIADTKTSYAIEKIGFGDKYYIILTNPDISKERNYIVRTKKQMQDLGLLPEKDRSESDEISNAIAESGKRTTNLTGNPQDGYFRIEDFPLLKNQKDTRYSATADVVKAVTGDVYGLKFHFYDAAHPENGWRTFEFERTLNKDDLSSIREVLSTIGPKDIENKIYGSR